MDQALAFFVWQIHVEGRFDKVSILKTRAPKSATGWLYGRGSDIHLTRLHAYVAYTSYAVPGVAIHINSAPLYTIS